MILSINLTYQCQTDYTKNIPNIRTWRLSCIFHNQARDVKGKGQVSKKLRVYKIEDM